MDDLLDTSRARLGKLQIRPAVVELAGLVQRAVEFTRSLYQAKHHRIYVSLPERPVRFQADPLRLEQAVVNLLVNAAKYSDNGGEVRLEVSVAEGQLLIRVRDDGIGITPEMLPRIFDLFAQTDQAIDRSQGGLGIGLTLARSLVPLHGGTLTASSPGLGQGSEFVITLPLVEPAPCAGPRAGKAAQPGRRLRLLLVADHDQAVESLSMIMRLWGHDTRVATNGPEAIAAARTYCPDVVILDIGLPGMDGFEVARELHKLPELEDVRLIALSGYSDDTTLKRSREAGFDHHLVKPADFDALEGILANIDGDERLPQELRKARNPVPSPLVAD